MKPFKEYFANASVDWLCEKGVNDDTENRPLHGISSNKDESR